MQKYEHPKNLEVAVVRRSGSSHHAELTWSFNVEGLFYGSTHLLVYNLKCQSPPALSPGKAEGERRLTFQASLFRRD